jgi:hypothetical protein
MMSACSLCRCFPGEVAVAHRTLRRHFRCRWKQVRLFRVSPAHRILLILGALAWRSTLGHLRTPFVLSRKSTWGRIRCMNPTRRTPNRTLVFTRRTGTCHPRTRESHRWWRARLAGRTRIRSVRYETMDTKKSDGCRREIQVLTVHLDDYVNQTFDECFHCLFDKVLYLYLLVTCFSSKSRRTLCTACPLEENRVTSSPDLAR